MVGTLETQDRSHLVCMFGTLVPISQSLILQVLVEYNRLVVNMWRLCRNFDLSTWRQTSVLLFIVNDMQIEFFRFHNYYILQLLLLERYYARMVST